MQLWFNSVAIVIQRPESALEHSRGIILPPELSQPRPVLSITTYCTRGWLVTAKELQVLHQSSKRLRYMLLLTAGYGPPVETGVRVLYIQSSAELMHLWS